MKKVSYILWGLGGILIIVAIILVFNGKSNVNDIPWDIAYEKGTYNDNNITEYDSDKYKMVVINQNRVKAAENYGYYVPSDLYLSGIYDYSVMYENDKISIIRNGSLIRENNIDFTKEIINQYENYNYVNLSSYQLSNGNQAYLLKTTDNSNYFQILILYIKAIDGYYKIEYHLNNMKFSRNFLNNVLEEDIDASLNNNDVDGLWHLFLDVPGEKHFTMRFDEKKYQLANELLFEDYMLMLYNNSNKVIKIMLLYDVNENISQIVESNYLYSSSNSNNEKTINGYLVKKYHYVEDIDYDAYTIDLDSKTKLLIISPSDSKLDINDFLNFTYE